MNTEPMDSEDGRPPEVVLAAFGANAPLQRLAGGKGGTWRSGEIVLKPAEGITERTGGRTCRRGVRC